MAGTPKAGRLRKVYIETTSAIPGPQVLTAIGGVQDSTLTIARSEIEVTDADSLGWDEFISGNANASISLTLTGEEDDVGQAKLLDLVMSGAASNVKFETISGTVGANVFTSACIVTQGDTDTPNKDAAGFSATLRLSGAVTKLTQV